MGGGGGVCRAHNWQYCDLHVAQFYIKDTKSSNGTFVNENRLSPSGEESGLVELKSRDILQFGVNVNVERRGVYSPQ